MTLISPLNKQPSSPFIVPLQSMGGNDYGISGHLYIFAFLKRLIILLRCNVFRASLLHPITDTGSMQFFKVETLLNNAFKDVPFARFKKFETPK